MKINTKDIAASLFLLAVGVVGLWLNQDHALGSARRMGPGYMPMLVFWVQIGLAAMVFALAMVNGPDPLKRWTGVESSSAIAAVVVGSIVLMLTPLLGPTFSQNYMPVGLGSLAGFLVLCYAAGWRFLGYICAAMCVFSLVLEKGGLMLAIIGTIGVAALAEPEHRAKPIGVLGVTIFLLALCWWVFIRELDIRVPVWPWSL